MRESSATSKLNFSSFHLSCWVLGLIALVQLMSVGVALALRGATPQIEQVVETRYIPVASSSNQPIQVVPPTQPSQAQVDGGAGKEPDKISVDPIDSETESLQKDLPEVLTKAPVTGDPIVERLIEEANAARIAGDLAAAHLKLFEAKSKDPENASILFGLAKNFEAFGVFEKADEFYLQVFQMGPLGAGSYFEKAAIRLEAGLSPLTKDLAKLEWGRMTGFERMATAEKRSLLLPISVNPGKDFEPGKLNPQVRFFEKIDGKVSPAVIREGESGSEWLTETPDWNDGEEIAKIWYLVPDRDEVTGYLYGEREHYGFVAELYYENKLIDIIAQPRTLLREVKKKPGIREFIDELEGLDLPNGGGILPSLDDEEEQFFLPEGEILPEYPGGPDPFPQESTLPSLGD